MEQPLLAIDDLGVTFAGDDGPARVVDGVSLRVRRGRTLGVVGESGCGKSMTALAVMGLVPPPGIIDDGTIQFEGTELRHLDETALARVRGARIAMVFQEPMSALNPVVRVGEQIAESLLIHGRAGRRQARAAAVDGLARLGIADPGRVARSYPHQLSGGMRQRAMIAMALACRPDLLIADEPTTALDVTVQAQIVDLLLAAQADLGMGMMFISHNLAVVSEVADEAAVMYAGRVVESGPAPSLFATPRHPYTRALMATLPGRHRRGARLPAIPGTVPRPGTAMRGCRFAARCPLAIDACRDADPPLDEVGPHHRAACIRADEVPE